LKLKQPYVTLSVGNMPLREKFENILEEGIHTSSPNQLPATQPATFEPYRCKGYFESECKSLYNWQAVSQSLNQ